MLVSSQGSEEWQKSRWSGPERLCLAATQATYPSGSNHQSSYEAGVKPFLPSLAGECRRGKGAIVDRVTVTFTVVSGAPQSCAMQRSGGW